MRPFWTTERKIILGFGGALLVLIMIAGISVWLTMALLDELTEVSIHNNVIQAIREFRNSMAQMAGAARLYAADESEKNYTEFLHQQEDTASKLDDLSALIGAQGLEREPMSQIERIIKQKIDRTRRGTDPVTLQGTWSPDSFTELRELLVKIDREEQNFLRDRNAEAVSKAQLALVTIGLASVLALVLVGGAAAVILRDLNTRRRAAEELERARLAAESASVAESAFLANMSHELRTPLTSILGYADLLLAPESGHEGENGRRREDYVRTMRRSGEHLLTLINDILDVSKIEAGRMQVESVECSLVEVIADVQSMMRSRAADKGIGFLVDYATAIPERILTDPTRVRQILMNLLGNAVKFTDTGSIRVLVRFEPVASAAPDEDSTSGRIGRLEIDVIDTGVGISIEQQNLLFQPFAQADISTTRRFGGTGLGLSISRRLAEMLEGELSVTSESGRGSTFRLQLMVGVAGTGTLKPEQARQAVAVVAHDYAPRHLGIRVLLAEDGDESREVISLHLQHAGCEVTLAPDGAEAHRVATEASSSGKPFDVILMDMQMPVMDGYTATSKLRAEGYQGVIVALTAHALREDRERCLRVGCDEYAAKPVDMPALISLMERLCGRSGSNAVKDVTDRLMQDPVLRNLTRKFVDATARTMQEFTRLADSSRIAELGAAAHKLAGAAGAYGFHDITREAKTLESFCQDPGKSGPEAVMSQLHVLQQACAAARAQLADPVASI